MKRPGFFFKHASMTSELQKLEKALAVIRELSAETSWPEPVSPMPPESNGDEGFWPAGFSSGAVDASIRYGRNDLMILLGDVPSSTAAVFTTNLCCAAPVEVSREHLEKTSGSMRAVICNSGIANAATGEKGMDDARSMAACAASDFGLDAEEVVVASTGVIGQLLPMEKVIGGISVLPLVLQRESCVDAAMAIMTTDTFPKFFSLDVRLSGGRCRLSGIAKGSGMIAPNMATMLAFMATDAKITPELLKLALENANRNSFNAITVDGDTSTNDMAMIMASGFGLEILPDTDDFTLFSEALEALMTFLAKLIVIDGEGATKLVGITVEGAQTQMDAERAARTIAQSSLVKTAIHGEDANWGRIIAAAGRSGAVFIQEELELYFNDLCILRPSFVADFSEAEAAAIMAKKSYDITLRLGKGPGKSTIWTCDLSKEYVEINGSYRS
jgi:glutamate N-acetyltransferase / amino-acid N-acetyltransferase